MQLDGMHHITMITGDAPANVDFYATTLGLRLVKKTVNFDQPDAYHLYFGDEAGSPGSILTWFEFPSAAPGRSGPGMFHTIELAVADSAALDFWAQRLTERGTQSTRDGDRLRLHDPDGLSLVLVVDESGDPPLRAEHPEVPAEHAIRGVTGVRAFTGGESPAHAATQTLLAETLGFTALGDDVHRLQGPTRHLDLSYDVTDLRGIPGAGTIHHLALHSRDEDHEAWRSRAGQAGMHVTPVIDRDYFHAIYFREPEGMLFEIATTSPGFAVDEDPAHLGEGLRLPRQHEHLRAQLEPVLTPLVNPRTVAAR